MLLLKNMLIKWSNDESEKERIDRILWVDPAKKYVYTFNIEDKKALPIKKSYDQTIIALNQSEASIITRENTHLFQLEEQLSQKQRERWEANWSLIEPLVYTEDEAIFMPEQRGELVETVSKQTGRSKRLIYEYLRRYWREGQLKNALIPRFDLSGLKPGVEPKPTMVKRGRPKSGSEYPGVNIDGVTKELLKKGYERFYISGECKTLTAAYHRTLSTFFRIEKQADGNGSIQFFLPPKSELPTLRQFKYHCHHRDQHDTRLALRKENSRAKTKYGSKLMEAWLTASGPGMRYLIYSTPVDCLLVSSLGRYIFLGKPKLYFVKDQFSKMIVGFEVSLERANWVTEILAIQNALSNKVTFCQNYGITITSDEWPCHHVPEFLLGDWNDHKNTQVRKLMNTLGVQVSNLSPNHSDLKDLVESNFDLVNYYPSDQLLGRRSALQKRGNKYWQAIPCLTLFEFKRRVINYILDYNQMSIIPNYPMDKFMLADELKPVPLHLWNWGLGNRNLHLHHIDPEMAYQSLLPRAQATITRQGIVFKGLRYFSGSIAKQLGDLQMAKETERMIGKKVTVAYDPRNTSAIFLCLSDRIVARWPLMGVDQQYADQEWVEVEAQKAFEANQRFELASSGQVQELILNTI